MHHNSTSAGQSDQKRNINVSSGISDQEEGMPGEAGAEERAVRSKKTARRRQPATLQRWRSGHARASSPAAYMPTAMAQPFSMSIARCLTAFKTSGIIMQTPFDPNASATAATPQAPVQEGTAEDPKARWQQLIGPAKLRWSKLTEAELQKTQGIEHQLAVLVQGRYDIPRGDAYRQVRSFHETQKR
jgi:hypothetical protein